MEVAGLFLVWVFLIGIVIVIGAVLFTPLVDRDDLN